MNIVVDCSHGNSRKNHALQSLVLKDVVGQIVDGNRPIKLGDQKDLPYGVSITDACLGWEATAEGLRDAAARLRVLAR